MVQWDQISIVSCQKGPTRHAYAWQIGPFWQDTLDLSITYFGDYGDHWANLHDSKALWKPLGPRFVLAG